MGRCILLTGATGALGPSLTAELLSNGAGDGIHVLVRPGVAPARQRFGRWVNTVAAISGDEGRVADAVRLHLVVGDVAEDGLGLETEQRRMLAGETEVIVHAAADTRFRGSAEQQWNTNVEGTRRILEFAGQCPRLRQLILVSTICVAGTGTGCITETSFRPPDFINPYERSKWQAEQLVLASGLPAQVARVGIVAGSHSSGAVHRLGALHHALRWFGRGLIPMVPGTPRTTVDLIATETAAKFLARAVMQGAEAGTIWHIAAGRRAVPLTELMELVWEQYHPGLGRGAPKVVDAVTFQESQRAVDPRRQALQAHVMDSIDLFLPGLLLHPRVFDTREAEALWGGPLFLPDWREMMRRVVGFIRAQADKAEPRRAAVGAG